MPGNYTEATSPSPAQQLNVSQENYLKQVGNQVSCASTAMSIGAPTLHVVSAYKGTISYSSQQPIDEKTYNEDASITKCVTAWLLHDAIANSNGKISLNTTLGEIFPDLATNKPNWAQAKLWQLLTHTSGIPDNFTDETDWSIYIKDPQKVWTLQELIRVMWQYQKDKLDFTPGTQWKYSNTGYIFIGLVLQQVTGLPIKTLYENFFKKFGLKDIFYAENFITVPNFAHPTGPNGEDLSRAVNPSVLGSAGALVATVSTTHALIRLLDSEENPYREISETLYSTTTGQPIADVSASDPSAYSLGAFFRVFFQNLAGQTNVKVLDYEGEGWGYSTAWFLVPTNLGTVLWSFATNTEYTNVPTVSLLTQALQAINAIPVSDDLEATPVPQPTMPAAAKTSDAKDSVTEEKDPSCLSSVNSFLNHAVNMTETLASSLCSVLCDTSSCKDVDCEDVEETVDQAKEKLIPRL